MPFGSEEEFDPADPSQWARILALPHIVVQPKPPPLDGIGDWFVPGSAPSDASYPDNWFAPWPSAMPNAGQLPSGPQSGNTANPASSYPAAVPPNPFAADWSQIPASGVSAMAWDPPSLPLFPPSSDNNFSRQVAPSAPPIAPGLRTPTLGIDLPWPTTQSLPRPAIPQGGVLGALASLGTVGQGGILGALAPLGMPLDSAPASSLAAASFPGPAQPASPPMPGVLDALWQGLGAANRQLGQTVQSVSGPPTITAQDSPAAEPLGWSDVANPSRIAPKVAYQLAQSYPTLAGGIAGGYIGGQLAALAGPEAIPVGAIVGGSFGAAALSAAQTLGPVYAAELQKTPDDPEGAWNRAWRQAEISGLFSGASWAAFPARFFQSPVKHLVFQMFGVQPALAVGEKATRNIVEGRPATEGLGEAYGQGVVGTATTALGHKVVGRLLPTPGGGQPARTAGGGRGAVAEQSRPTVKGRGVWDLPATKRGRILEKIFGHNLHPNHPTIDIWDPSTGAVTSLKSVDLEAPGYQVQGQYPNTLYNKLSKNLNNLADFEGGRYAGADVRDIASRTLTVIVPSLGTAEQRQVLRTIIEVGKQRGVIVKIEVYR